MEIRHEPEQQRFVAVLPAGEAELRYVDRGDGVLDFVSTFTPPAERGKGVAARLVAAAVAYARERGLRVVASCWYARDWLAAHPEESAAVRP
ncbi:MAG: GNAT family N-acetyltransferase [Chloroflexota bacterium]|nr:N-acetyltransferase [Dehalococcoidia bacterium]MDW8252621.1 GNAT family N-acetyltransferase [Chloroflexota bacterium]